MTAQLTIFNGQAYLVDGNDVRRLSPAEYQQQKALRSDVRNMGQGERFAIGAGKGYSEMLSGVRQLTFGDTDQENALRQQRREGYAPMEQYGGMAPALGEFAASASTALLPGPRAAQTMIGAGQGMAENPNNPIQGFLVGGASSLLGDWAGDALGRMAARMTTKRLALSAEKSAVIEAAEKEGIEFRPGQKQAGTQRRIMEGEIMKNPIFAGIDESRWMRNQARLNQLGAQFLGVDDAAGVTGEVLAKAYRASKDGFKVVDNFDGAIRINADDMLREWEALTPDGEAFMKQFARKYPRVLDGDVSGREFMQARNWAAKVMRQKPELADDISAIIGVMDEGLENSVDLATRDVVRQARQGWKAMLTMEAAQRGAMQSAGGDVSPLSAYNALRRYYGRDFVHGKMDDPFANAVRGMAAAGDVAPPPRPSGDAATILNPMQLLQQNLITKPIAENYMKGGKLSEFLIGSSLQEPSDVGRQLGVGVFRGLMQDEEN